MCECDELSGYLKAETLRLGGTKRLSMYLREFLTIISYVVKVEMAEV